MLMRIVCGAWSFAPSEFWAMTMREFWWIQSYHNPPERVGTSSFTKEEVRRIAEEQRRINAEREDG
jgi:hypothetical protein